MKVNAVVIAELLHELSSPRIVGSFLPPGAAHPVASLGSLGVCFGGMP